MKVNAEEGGADDELVGLGGCDCCWRAARIEACAGSRREASMSDSVGVAVRIDGAGGRFDKDARDSQAAFSSSRLGNC